MCVLHSVYLRTFVAGCVLVVSAGSSLRGQQTINYTDGQTNSTFVVTNPPNDPSTLNVATGSATQSGQILGTGSIIKTGDGTLTISSFNTYDGDTHIQGGPSGQATQSPS